jgi:hypothetical protein
VQELRYGEGAWPVINSSTWVGIPYTAPRPYEGGGNEFMIGDRRLSHGSSEISSVMMGSRRGAERCAPSILRPSLSRNGCPIQGELKALVPKLSPVPLHPHTIPEGSHFRSSGSD